MFNLLFGASCGEQKSPTDEFWYNPVGGATASGVRVSPEFAMRCTSVYACVRVLSETLAGLPLIVYERQPGDRRTRAVNHPLYNVLRSAPNDNQTAFELFEMQMGHLCLRGNAYNEIMPGARGAVDQLLPIHPDLVTPEFTNQGVRYKIKGINGSKDRTLTGDEVMHNKGLSFDGLKGLNPIEYHRETVGMNMAAMEYGARFFENDATPRGVLELEKTFKTDIDRQKYKANLQASQTGENRHKMMLLENGATYKDIGMSHEDAQFLETRQYGATDIARIFRVPPHMIADLTKATFSNIEHQSLEFVIHTMRPWFVRWEQAITRSLIVAPQKYYVEFLVDALLRGDTKARYEAYKSGIEAGHLTRNEARIMENRNPLPGLDEPIMPLNMGTAGSNPQNARNAQIMKGVAGRIAHKEATAIRRSVKKYEHEGFKDWAKGFYETLASDISRDLAVDQNEAQAFAERGRIEICQAENTDAVLNRWETSRVNELIEVAA
jgi:HK97 family phage portal protein